MCVYIYITLLLILELRAGILEFHKLKFSDFANEEEAMNAVLEYMKFQRNLIPDIEKQHPDITMPNPKACLYWYVMNEGMATSWKKKHSQEYGMSAKLNDKDVKSIADHGSKDLELGMMVPHVVDMVAVKKEVQALDELEKVKKETESA